MTNFSLSTYLKNGNCLVRRPYFIEVTSYEKYTLGICSVLNGITSVSAIVGNVLILVLLLWKSQLRTNPNILLGCLAMTDLLTGAIVQPMFVLVNTQSLLVHTSWCGAFVIYDVAQFVCGLCSSYISILVTSDRCLAVSYPYRYPAIVTKTRIAVITVLVWLVWSSLTISRFFVRRGKHYGLILIISFFLSFLIVAILYIKMLRIAKRHQNQINAQNRGFTEFAKRQRREGKAMKTAMYIIGAYIICYLPYIVGRLFFVIDRHPLNPRYVAMVWCKTLLYINSSLNPFILFWRVKKVRKALWDTLRFR